MTNPGGPGNFALGPVQKAVSVFGAQGGPDATGSLSKLADWDQATIEALLKQLYVQDNPNINGPLGIVFSGLRAGISLPLALLEALINKLMGTNLLFLSVEHALAFAKKVPILTDLIEAITGVEDGDLNDLGTWFLNIRNFLASINFMDPDFDPAVAAAQFVNLILLPLNLLLGPQSPLNPANILGRLRIHQIGGVPLANVITQTANLFAEFISAASVPNADGWSFDAANNAAQVVLDGTTKAIYDDPVDVAPGQELDASIRALLASVTSTPGSAVQLALLTYDGISESPTGTVVLASIANPSGSATWATLSGSYTVPATGVKAVAPALKVVGGTSGTVKFKTPAGELVLPNSLQGGLKTIFDELRDIFDSKPVETPVNPVADVIKNWWDVFFNGGPKQVVTQQQVSEPSGVPPTDADNVIPWVYLPPELTPAAIGHPWVELTKVGSQTITANTVTKLTAFSQNGGFPLTDTSSAFSVPFAGLFHVKIRATWANTPETTMRVILYKNGVQYRMDNRFGDALGSVLGYNEVSEYVPLDVGDNIDFRVFWLGSGSTKDISVTNTYARITYIGATHLTSTPIPTPTVTFDAKGTEGSGGTSPTKVTSHTFGPNANTIVIPISHTWSSPITVTVTDGATNYDIPVLSGPTFIGTYFGFDAYYSLAAAILPTSVRGKTVSVTVTSAASTGAWSFKSLSFNGVAYLGAVRTSSGSGSARLLVPSNAFSQVAGGFGGMDANFSGFNRTVDLQTSFSAGQHWAHVMGHAQGGLEFTASGGKWAGKFIELHP